LLLFYFNEKEKKKEVNNLFFVFESIAFNIILNPNK